MFSIRLITAILLSCAGDVVLCCALVLERKRRGLLTEELRFCRSTRRKVQVE